MVVTLTDSVRNGLLWLQLERPTIIRIRQLNNVNGLMYIEVNPMQDTYS